MTTGKRDIEGFIPSRISSALRVEQAWFGGRVTAGKRLRLGVAGEGG